MDKITVFIEEKVAPPLIKFSQLKYIQVMQRTGLGIMSLLVIGSVFLLIASFPYQPWLDFMGEFRWVIAKASGVGTGFIAVFTVITVSYGLVEYYNNRDKEQIDIVQPLILSVGSFFLLNPAQTVTTMMDGIEGSYTGVPTTYMGAVGVFAAIIIAIVTVELYRLVIKAKLTIKLPEGVPPMVAQSFTALIPSFIVVLFWWILGFVFNLNIAELITNLFKPFVAVGDTAVATMLATGLNRILWSVGIHGSNIVNSVGGTIWGQMAQTNLTDYQAGKSMFELSHTFTTTWMDNYIWTGLFPLSLSLLLSKAPRLKSLGKLSIVPALFNIGEPLIFGLPIMLNPIMIIPFILSSTLQAIFAIIFTNLGIIPVPALLISWIMPAPIKTYLATAGNIPATLFVIFGWVMTFFIYYPFVKVMTRNEIEEANLKEAKEKAKELESMQADLV